MFDVAISELTSSRWDLQREIGHAVAHGFDAISLWRPKVSDVGAAAAGRLISAAGLRVSSLQWAGGFTGADGRSFAESVEDAAEAITMAATVGAPALVVHSGCRGGHTRSHAVRLVDQALESLAPLAERAGVTLALKPVHPHVSAGCSFLAGLEDALAVVERLRTPAVRLALDLWHFGDDPAAPGLLPALARATAILQVADRCGPPAAGVDRLPAGHGRLAVEWLVCELVELGYDGPVEFDPVGETVEILGYEAVWRETRLVADHWSDRHAIRRGTAPHGADVGRLPVGRGHFRAAAAGAARKSHASTHSGSPG
jgi:sugar phosphate isomerase/epimerase